MDFDTSYGVYMIQAGTNLDFGYYGAYITDYIIMRLRFRDLSNDEMIQLHSTFLYWINAKLDDEQSKLMDNAVKEMIDFLKDEMNYINMMDSSELEVIRHVHNLLITRKKD